MVTPLKAIRIIPLIANVTNARSKSAWTNSTTDVIKVAHMIYAEDVLLVHKDMFLGKQTQDLDTICQVVT